MTVRYERRGLRVVRVPTPAAPGASTAPQPPPGLEPGTSGADGPGALPLSYGGRGAAPPPGRGTSSPEGAYPQTTGGQPAPSARAPSVTGEDYTVRLHRFAAEIRGAARRYRRSVSWGGDTPRTRPPSPVTPEQLKAARTLAGLKQWQLAERVGMSRSQVAEAESGRRYVNTRLGDWAAGVLAERGS
jgi:Helix-turn-helix